MVLKGIPWFTGCRTHSKCTGNKAALSLVPKTILVACGMVLAGRGSTVAGAPVAKRKY